MPLLPAYSISKAAEFSLSQSLRALLAGRGVTVYAVMAGPVDTDMSRDLAIPKSSPESVARAILDGVARGDEGCLPRSHVRAPWLRAGTPVRPKASNARTPLSWPHSLWRHKEQNGRYEVNKNGCDGPVTAPLSVPAASRLLA